MTLKDVPVGNSVMIKKILVQGALKRRFMDMGLIKGTTVMVQKVAPLGDPIQVRVRGYELSIRKEEAKQILVV